MYLLLLQLLKKIYGPNLQDSPEQDYNVTLLYNLEDLPENKEKTAASAALLKRHCFASVFLKYFEFQEKEEAGHKRAVIHYRDDETM